MDNPNIAIKDRFVAAVFAGDRQTLRELLDPAFQLHQPPGLTYSGDYHGVAGFFAFLDKFMAAYDLELFESTALYIEQSNPDALALGFHIKGVARATQRPFDSPQFECWDFKNGKLVRIRVFWFRLP